MAGFTKGATFLNLTEFPIKLIEFQSSTKYFYARSTSKLLTSIHLLKPYNEDAIFYELKYVCIRSGNTSSTNPGYSSEKIGCPAHFRVRLQNKMYLAITSMELDHNHDPETEQAKIDMLNESTKISIEDVIKKNCILRNFKNVAGPASVNDFDKVDSFGHKMVASEKQEKYTTKQLYAAQEMIIKFITRAIVQCQETTKDGFNSYFMDLIKITNDFQNQIIKNRLKPPNVMAATTSEQTNGTHDSPNISDAELLSAAEEVERMIILQQSSNTVETAVNSLNTSDTELLRAAEEVERMITLQHPNNTVGTAVNSLNTSDIELLRAAEEVECDYTAAVNRYSRTNC